MDHNRYDNAGADAGFWDERSGSSFYGTFAKWPAHIKAEAGSTQGDPGLDATGHLVAGSPCIDAGRALAEVTDDIDGGTRVPTVRVRRIEPLGGLEDVPDTVKKAVATAEQKRTGRNAIPFDIVEVGEHAFGDTLDGQE